MKKHPVFITLLIAAVAVGAGASVAYYNTKSFGFDEDTVIFSRDNDSVTFFDYKVYYSDVERFYDESRQYLPEKAYSTNQYIVDGFDLLSNIMYI